MSNDKQTAVQILVDSLIKLGYLHSNEFGQSPKVIELINQAKAMEKEQIVKAANFDSKSISENGYRKGEQYYNETYGGNK
jgi:hypothetical protein